MQTMGPLRSGCVASASSILACRRDVWTTERPVETRVRVAAHVAHWCFSDPHMQALPAPSKGISLRYWLKQYLCQAARAWCGRDVALGAVVTACQGAIVGSRAMRAKFTVSSKASTAVRLWLVLDRHRRMR